MLRGTQVKRDGLVITVERRGHLKWDCSQGSKPTPVPCPICKGPHWRIDCPPTCRSQGSDSQGNWDWWFLGGPHTSSHPNYIWGTLGINNCGGPIRWFPFGHWGNFLCAHWSTWSTFLPIHYHNGAVWMSKTLLFQSSFKLQLGLCNIFSQVSNCARVSLTLSGEGYTEQGPGLYFYKYGDCSFSPINWTKYKS